MKNLLTLTALAAGATLPVQAAITVTYDDLTGYNESDVIFTPANTMDNAAFIRDLSGQSYRGGLQTFSVASNIEISAVNLIVSRLQSGASSTFRIFELPGTPGDSITQTNLLTEYTLKASDTIVVSAAQANPFSTDADSTLTWTLPSSVALETGKLYAFVMEGVAQTNSIVWRYDPVNGYDDGVGYYSNDSSAQYESDTFNSNNSDFSLGLVAVPEPSTYAALVGVLALGMVMLRRRRG